MAKKQSLKTTRSVAEIVNKMNSLYGRDLLCTQDWSIDELEKALDLSFEFKANRYDHALNNCLDRRTFFMFFYNPSVRTRQSFEAAATELGGHAQFLEPKSMRLKSAKSAGETIEDAANVMSRYACGIGIRILETALEYYGQGHEMLQEPPLNTTVRVMRCFRSTRSMQASQSYQWRTTASTPAKGWLM
jgi:N-acetylornithine carbamoyltransferase